VDMGMEWRLVSVGGEGHEVVRRGKGDPNPEPVPVHADADLKAFYATLSSSGGFKTMRAFHAAGISSLEQFDAMPDGDLMALEGVGWKTIDKVRAFIAAREAARADEPPDTSPTLDSLGLSKRTMAILSQHGMETLADLKYGLRKLPNDRAMIREIEKALDGVIA
jgi:hypothetical protein